MASVVLAGCSGSSGPEGVLDWSGGGPVVLSDGVRVERCAGDGPLQCVTDADGALLGAFELLVAPAGAGEEGLSAAQEAAAGLLEAVERDRARGCPALTFSSDGVRDAVVAGAPGVRVGFRMLEGERVVERSVVWIAFVGGERVVVNAAGYDEGACVARVGEFSVADLDRLVDELDVLVADSPLP